MGNVVGAQARPRKFARQNHASSSAQEIRDNIQDLGSSVGDMATHQYERAHEAVIDTVQEASRAVQRNPLTAIGIGLGVGFLFGLISGGRAKPIPRSPV